ncbi:Bud-site selection protein [Wallemia mellicola]|uniref:Bud-site selection protein n=1 Tax=Wallemia mellicola TaxID=1708541 RepID=A0A4T0LZ08_9BASI|nr:Bud-site selection protein [Wallemia mellicola]
MTRTIAIIGAGPAGLCLANILKQDSDFEVQVYEKDSHINERSQGGTLDLHEDGQDALKAAGVYQEFQKHARYDDEDTVIMDKHATKHIEIKDQDTGRPEVDRIAIRNFLYQALPESTVKWGAKVVKVDERNVYFADGKSRKFDLIVGADGAWSKVRPVLSTIRPFYSGISGFEGNIRTTNPKHADIAKLFGQGSTFAMGETEGCLVTQRTGDGSYKVYFYKAYHENWINENGLDEEDGETQRAYLLQEIYSWSDSLKQIVRSFDDDIKQRAMYMLPPGMRWESKESVSLIGDAFSLMTPFAGLGVNVALAQAHMLAQMLIKHKDNQIVAIEKYEGIMHTDADAKMTKSWNNLQTFMNKGGIDFFKKFLDGHGKTMSGAGKRKATVRTAIKIYSVADDTKSENAKSKKQKVEKPEETFETRTEKLQKKLVNLRRATKDAKTSERQRLQKKITQAEKKSAKGEEIDRVQLEETQNQLNETKDYDGLIAAQHTFFSKLSKHSSGAYKTREEVILALKNLNFDFPNIAQASNAPEGKLAARFMSIEQVSKVAKAGVDSVSSILGDSAAEKQKQSEQLEDSKESAEDDEVDDKLESNTTSDKPAPREQKATPTIDSSALIAKLTGALGGVVRDDEDEDNDAQSDAGSDISAPLSGYTSGEASNEEDALKDWPEPEEEVGESNEEEEEESDDEDEGGNTILDSLNAGVGYISGSDDDISDAEEKVAPRKNRMGQRARRAILEKKYGRGANHIQKKFEEQKQLERAKKFGKNKLDSGWKGRQQQQSGGYKEAERKDFKRDFKKFDKNAKQDRKSGSGRPPPRNNKPPQKPTKAEDEGPLHPSWAAKKAQAKAIENAPAPTKITFDD